MVDLLISAIADMIAVGLNAAVDLLLPLLDFDFTSFNEAFPFAAKAYSVFQAIALALVLLLAAVHIIPMLSGSSDSKTSPIRAGLFVIISVAAIYYGNHILTVIMDIAQSPYDAIKNADTSITMAFSFDPIRSAIADAAAGTSLLLYIFLLIMIGIAFLKLLLEAVERYVILFVLIYLSPLASSSLATEPTSGIFKRFMSMFISQCILLILNVWSLKMTISMFDGLGTASLPMLSLLMGYSFLRIASKLDSYLNQLGLSAAVTGAGLGNELFATGMMLMSRMGNGKAQNMSSASNNSDSGGILGFSQKMASGIKKVNPVSGAAEAGKNTVMALGKTIGQGITSARGAMSGSSGSPIEQISTGLNAAGTAIRENVGSNLHDASMKTQGTSLWARGAMRAVAGHESVETLVGNAVSGHGLTSEERHDLANNAFVGDKVMHSFRQNNETTESADIAATMQSIGLDTVDPDAEYAIDAGYGNIETENTDYVQNENGIQASYTKDGWNENWDVKTAAQYESLSSDEQQSYTAFQSKNGGKYYYSHSRSRAPSEYQKEQMAVTSAVAAFLADPQNASLSQAEWAAVSRHPDAYNQTWSGLRESGQMLGQTEQEKNSIKGMLAATKIPGGKLTEGKNAAIAHLDDASASWDGNTTQVSWEQENGRHQFEMLSQSEAAKIGTPAQMHELGYSTLTIGDETYLAKYTAPPTDLEQLEVATKAFVSNPHANPMSEKEWSNLGKNTSAYNQVWDGMVNNNTSIGGGTDEQKQVSGMLSASKAANTRTNAGRNEAIAYLNSGKAEIAQMNGHGAYVSWTNAEGYKSNYTVLTEQGAQAIGASPTDLHNAGYEAIDVGGHTYYTHYQGTPTKQEQLSQAITDFAESPKENPMSSSDFAEMWKNPESVNQMFNQMEENGTALIYTPGQQTPANAQIADFISNSRFTGLSPADKSSAVTNLLSGEAKYAKLDGRGVTIEYTENGEGRRITVLSPNAVKNPNKVTPKVSTAVNHQATSADTAAITSEVVQTTAPLQTPEANEFTAHTESPVKAGPVPETRPEAIPKHVSHSDQQPVPTLVAPAAIRPVKLNTEQTADFPVAVAQNNTGSIMKEPVIRDADPVEPAPVGKPVSVKPQGAPTTNWEIPDIHDSKPAPVPTTTPAVQIPKTPAIPRVEISATPEKGSNATDAVTKAKPDTTVSDTVLDSPGSSEQQRSRKPNKPAPYEIDYVKDRGYQHSTIGNERYFALRERRPSDDTASDATNDLL